ncbi:MAG: hypothetical protein ABSG49_01760 [Methanoregula sp.]|jgi:hypothetical protein|uniref:DUF7289 family protein n=1 Tax=Methanoregula sp. TaxID=2052170 RepID=UPI003C233B98
MAVRKYSLAERGVSEAIGFMLIFSIMIAGIGLVTLYGYPTLIQQQSSANERIMEKNMIVLQNDVKSLAYKTVPYKESSLKVEGGSLTVYNASSTPAVFTMDITNNCGSPTTYYVGAFRSGDLRYSSDSADTDISLQNGAVVKRQHAESGSAMLAEPRWFYDNKTNTMVINLIGFNSTTSMSRAGIGTVQTAMGATNYTYVNIPAGNSLCVNYTSDTTLNGQDYSVAWDNYFMKTLNNAPDITVYSRTGTPGNGGSLKYTLTVLNPMTLVIKKYDMVIKSL